MPTDVPLDQLNGMAAKRRSKTGALPVHVAAAQTKVPSPPKLPPDPATLEFCEDGFLCGAPPEPWIPLETSPVQLRNAAEKRNDPLGFFLTLAASHPRSTDLGREFERLSRLVRGKALKDPDELAAQIVDHGLSLAANLHFRLAFSAERLLSSHDLGRDGQGGVPPEIFDSILSALVKVDGYIADSRLARAKVEQQGKPACAEQIEIDEAEGRPHKHDQSSESAPNAEPRNVPNKKRRAGRGGKEPKSPAANNDLSLTLSCDRPDESFEIERLALQMGFSSLFEHPPEGSPKTSVQNRRHSSSSSPS